MRWRHLIAGSFAGLIAFVLCVGARQAVMAPRDECARTGHLQIYSNASFVEEAGDVIGYELAFQERNGDAIEALLYIYEGVPNEDGTRVSGQFSGNTLTVKGERVEHLVEHPSGKEMIETEPIEVAGTLSESQFRGTVKISGNATSLVLNRVKQIWMCQERSGSTVPEIFGSILAEVKAKAAVPVLLPSELPKPLIEAKHAEVGKATASGYAISLYSGSEMSDAGFVAFFAADGGPKYDPRELPNTSSLKLARGIDGFFRPVSCGGSCAPANLWWEEGGVLYQLQLRLSPNFTEAEQVNLIMEVANSAILAGPR